VSVDLPEPPLEVLLRAAVKISSDNFFKLDVRWIMVNAAAFIARKRAGVAAGKSRVIVGEDGRKLSRKG
jgi:hypothetical protein